jgi:hypothetical protein
MANVASAVGTTALFLASADWEDVAPLAWLIERAREARMDTERRNQAPAEVISAWTVWYDEAVASVTRLAGPRGPR